MTSKILLIEDDEIMRENTAEILGLAQYEILTASDGREGSKMAKKMKPDLIISDIMMPGLDGYGVLHVLSKDPSTASIPIIFLSAKAEKTDWRRGMDLGADDYITKPFEDTELLNAVEARLKKKEAARIEYSRDLEGLNHFLEEAKGLKELEDLSTQRPVSRYKKKEIVFHAGDIPHYLYFLIKGRVKIFKTHNDGKEYITNICEKGEFFGYSALFENQTYSDTAYVMEESEICKIPKEDFFSLIFKNRDVAAKFVKMLSNHIEEQEKRLIRLAYDTVRKRTADTLLTLYKQFNRDGDGVCISVTREDLASIAGTAMETVIRCLSEFKEDKLIEVKGREITIINSDGLQKIQ